jgi:hypothetical protein
MENEKSEEGRPIQYRIIHINELARKVVELEERVSRLERSVDELLKVKGEVSGVKTCRTCKWSKRSGPHVGCYYNYEWRAWIPQKFIDIFAYCETPNGEYLKKSVGAKWEKGE